MTNSSDADEIAETVETEVKGLTVVELLEKSASCCEKGLVLHLMCKECHATVVTVGE